MVTLVYLLREDGPSPHPKQPSQPCRQSQSGSRSTGTAVLSAPTFARAGLVIQSLVGAQLGAQTPRNPPLRVEFLLHRQVRLLHVARVLRLVRGMSNRHTHADLS